MDKVKSPIVGTCTKMCPDEEAQKREEEGLLHPLELSKKALPRGKDQDKKTYRPKGDPRKIVKSFARSSVGQRAVRAEELRPIKTLNEVVDYLFNKVLIDKETPWNVIYDFIFDRLRAVRQDISIQCINDTDSLNIFERIIRFHIYAAYRIKTDDLTHCDAYLNEKHMLECLRLLLHKYDEMNDTKRFCRPLFEAIYIIHYLGSPEGLIRYGKLPKEIKNHNLIKTAFRISIDFMNSHYYRVIRQLHKLKLTILLIIGSFHIPKVYLITFQRMSHAYGSKNSKFPLSVLTQWLCPSYGQESKARQFTIELCEFYGMPIQDEFVILNKNYINEKAGLFPYQKFDFIEIPFLTSGLSSIINGRKESKALSEF